MTQQLEEEYVFVSYPSPDEFPGILTVSGERYPRVAWDKPDERYFIHGVDRGTLYIPGLPPVPWNGIIGVDETSTGTASVLYRDGKIYLADVDPGDFEGVLKAYFYPDQFAECLGIPQVTNGLYIDAQKPKQFGLSYRSLIGSGTTGDMFGYQIHLVYNAMATLGTISRKTLTGTPELTELTFGLVATPVQVPGYRPSAHMIIDTRNLDPEVLVTLEEMIYGNDFEAGALPDPVDLYDLLEFGSSITITDHGDGTWTATGPKSKLIDNGDGTWQILGINGVDHGDGTYTISDTP